MTLSASLLLGACENPNAGGSVLEGFSGLVVGDEPRAVHIGEQILDRGGSAIDAAVAMYFALSVTMPSRVGLAGGGACVLFTSGDTEDEVEPFAEVLEFLPGQTANQGPEPDAKPETSGALTPIAPRAFNVIHARRGLMRWQELVIPAEKMASFGYPVSRAFSQDINNAGALIAQNPELAGALTGPGGRIVREGDILVQADLGSVLSGIREKGINYLYKAPFGSKLSAAYNAAGVPMTEALLAQNFPRIDAGVRVRVGSYFAYLPSPPVDGGLLTAQLWQLLYEVEELADVDEDERAHLLAEASARAFSQRVKWLPTSDAADLMPLEEMAVMVDEDYLESMFETYDPDRHLAAATLDPPPQPTAANPYSAGFVVADLWGDTVSCSFTMNGLFGRGQFAAGTGMLLPEDPAPGASSLSPVVVGNENTGDMRFAGVASGGPAGPVALASVMLQTLEEDKSLAEALKAPRVANFGAPDETFVEVTLPTGEMEALQIRGHQVTTLPSMATVSAIFCPEGLLDEDEACQVESDPRGFGMGGRIQ
ncbi:MAG: gamma-glutamyltransferase [Pseudomonadota bacterium]